MIGKSRRRLNCVAILCASLAAVVTAAAKRTDNHLPERYQAAPYTVMSLSVGAPGAGWQLRAKKLNPSPSLIIKDGSEENVFALPALILMLGRTAKQMVQNVQSEPLLVGDLSAEHGGPLYGHHSHQSGRDADVGFFALDAEGKPLRMSRFVAYSGDGKARDQSGARFDDYRNWLMVLTWLKDERADIQYVFVSTPLRKRLLDFASARPEYAPYVEEVSQFLLQPPNADPHDDHFHVRIACPKSNEGLCRDYGPVPRVRNRNLMRMASANPG
jgi:penicillin-insensitive murein DD-endopeptidase